MNKSRFPAQGRFKNSLHDEPHNYEVTEQQQWQPNMITRQQAPWLHGNMPDIPARVHFSHPPPRLANPNNNHVANPVNDSIHKHYLSSNRDVDNGRQNQTDNNDFHSVNTQQLKPSIQQIPYQIQNSEQHFGQLAAPFIGKPPGHIGQSMKTIVQSPMQYFGQSSRQSFRQPPRQSSGQPPRLMFNHHQATGETVGQCFSGDPPRLFVVQPPTQVESQVNSEQPVLSNDRQYCDRNEHITDLSWINRWLASKQKQFKLRDQYPHGTSPTSIEIGDVTCHLHECYKLLDHLNGKIAETVQCPEAEQAELYQSCVNTQKAIDDMIKFHLNDQILEDVSRKLSRRRSKRLRLKQKRVENYEEKKACMEQRNKLHDELNKWQQGLLQKQIDKKNEQEMKKLADATLGEVRRKVTDANKSLRVMEALKNLRELRKRAVGQKGLKPPEEYDISFNSTIQELETLMNAQKSVYETEQRALETMLETEVEENKEKQLVQLEKEECDKRRKNDRKINSILFGSSVTESMYDPIRPYRDFYLQAETDLNSLYHIRHNWDQFIVPSNTEGATSIPVNWVAPVEPSSDVWESAVVLW